MKLFSRFLITLVCIGICIAIFQWWTIAIIVAVLFWKWVDWAYSDK